MPARNVRRSITGSARRKPAVVGYAGSGAIGSGPWYEPSFQAGRECSRAEVPASGTIQRLLARHAPTAILDALTFT